MNVDRIAELKAKRAASGRPAVDVDGASDGLVSAAAQAHSIAEHTRQYDDVKAALVLIRDNVATIEKLKEKSRKTADDRSRKEIMAQLDAVMDQTTSKGGQVKRTLDKIKQENEQFKARNPNSAQSQIRANLYQTHIRRFHQCMTEYNEASTQFKRALKERTRRQLKIVDKDITDEEVDTILESGRAQDVIKQALISSEDLEDVVRDIEERHQGILKLEQQVLEVYELFRDLATLVDLQQESLDVISNRISQAKDYTEKAETELVKAEDYQKKARKRQCCILIIVLAVLVVILAPIIAKQSEDS